MCSEIFQKFRRSSVGSAPQNEFCVIRAKAAPIGADRLSVQANSFRIES
jgi:hypothetical protein